MDQILALFERSLAEHQASIGKKDNLVGCGEIIIQEIRKQREQIITLGRLLADFYATQINGPDETEQKRDAVLKLYDYRRQTSPNG